MKKLISLLLAVVLMALPVLAANDQATVDPYEFDSVKLVEKALRANRIKYSDNGVSKDNDCVYLEVDYDSDYLEDGICIDVVVEEYNVSMYAFYLAEVPEENLIDALILVNNLNQEYRYITFFLDEEDYTITAEWFIYMIDDTVGEDVAEEIPTLVEIIEEALPDILALEKVAA